MGLLAVANQPLYNLWEGLEMKNIYKKGENHPIEQYSVVLELWDRVEITVFPIDTYFAYLIY